MAPEHRRQFGLRGAISCKAKGPISWFHSKASCSFCPRRDSSLFPSPLSVRSVRSLVKVSWPAEHPGLWLWTGSPRPTQVPLERRSRLPQQVGSNCRKSHKYALSRVYGMFLWWCWLRSATRASVGPGRGAAKAQTLPEGPLRPSPEAEQVNLNKPWLPSNKRTRGS